MRSHQETVDTKLSVLAQFGGFKIAMQATEPAFCLRLLCNFT